MCEPALLQVVRSLTKDERATAEAMLAQIVYLQARLERIGRTPASALDDEEKASEWLRKQALKRVWHSAQQRKTEAMRRSPRAVIE